MGEAKQPFEDVTLEQQYWMDEIIRQRGDSTGETVELGSNELAGEISMRHLISGLIDNTEHLLGDRKRGFRDSVHVMRYIVGDQPMPIDIPDFPDGSAPVCV